MQEPFKWDQYSDQPYPLKDKMYKRKMRIEHLWSYFFLLLINIIIFPVSILLMYWYKAKESTLEGFYGIGVDIDKGEVQKELIEELGIKYLLIRMPLWEILRVEEYVAFAKNFGNDKHILINILQDREHIEDTALLQKDIEIIFKSFSPFVTEFQIGNAINRTKWGFFSMDEYLHWYETIQKLRDKKYPDIKLIGSAVIDFEFHYTIRTLFNFFSIRYDKFSSLLYVDRRGSPYNKQMGIFDTKNKINMLYALVRLSSKVNNEIYITEVNWPLSNTAPFAPTSEVECVNEEIYSEYMQEYHDIAKRTRKIQRVYWHQLIASGYGLIDDRDGKIRKTIAYEAYKRMIKNANI